MDFKEKINQIESKEEFINFIELLIKDLKNNSKEWTNKTLLDYLNAMSNWVEDMEGYYINNNLPLSTNIDWKIFANILIAAKMYE